MKSRHLAAGLLALLAAEPALARTLSAGDFDAGTLASPILVAPDGPLGAAIVLVSDEDGWNKAEAVAAERLAGEGALVVGIDLPAYLLALRAEDRTCVYTVASIEHLSQQIQRAIGDGAYRLPIVAGIRGGGAMALAIAAQTPAATIGGTLAVDPSAGIALDKPLCTQAPHRRDAAGRTLYGLTPGALPNPVEIVLTEGADEAGDAHARELAATHPAVAIEQGDGRAADLLVSKLESLLRAEGARREPLDLPLTVLGAAPAHDAMAIIYSGDGGWRDIDKKLGALLQAAGVPVVGVDSLRYFWRERTPEETAADLRRIMDDFRSRFGVTRVVLIGFSFGANILPKTYLALGPDHRAAIVEVSLLSPSRKADFQISVLGWFGSEGVGTAGDPVEAAKAMDGAELQCFHGIEDQGSACPALASLGAEVVTTAGGHHFDGDYAALAEHILKGMLRRAD